MYNTLDGDHGNDLLEGDDGNDNLNGAQGNDTLIDNTGNNLRLESESLQWPSLCAAAPFPSSFFVQAGEMGWFFAR